MINIVIKASKVFTPKSTNLHKKNENLRYLHEFYMNFQANFQKKESEASEEVYNEVYNRMLEDLSDDLLMDQILMTKLKETSKK